MVESGLGCWEASVASSVVNMESCCCCCCCCCCPAPAGLEAPSSCNSPQENTSLINVRHHSNKLWVSVCMTPHSLEPAGPATWLLALALSLGSLCAATLPQLNVIQSMCLPRAISNYFKLLQHILIQCDVKQICRTRATVCGQTSTISTHTAQHSTAGVPLTPEHDSFISVGAYVNSHTASFT